MPPKGARYVPAYGRLFGDDEPHTEEYTYGRDDSQMIFVDYAVKYNPEGQRVTLFCVCSEGQLRVDVGDLGPGIPERLSSEFVQLA